MVGCEVCEKKKKNCVGFCGWLSTSDVQFSNRGRIFVISRLFGSDVSVMKNGKNEKEGEEILVDSQNSFIVGIQQLQVCSSCVKKEIAQFHWLCSQVVFAICKLEKRE